MSNLPDVWKDLSGNKNHAVRVLLQEATPIPPSEFVAGGLIFDRSLSDEERKLISTAMAEETEIAHP